MEVEQNTMNLSGKNVFYLSYGRGLQRSFILLHDSKKDSSSWSGIDALRKLGQWGFNVYAPDYPGFGKSEYNPKYNLVQILQQVQDSLRIFQMPFTPA